MSSVAPDLEMFLARRDQVESLAWTRQTAHADASWLVDVDDDVGRELRAVAATVGGPIDGELLRRIELPVAATPELSALAARLRHLLLRGRGFVHLRGLGRFADDEGQLRLSYLLLSMRLGGVITSYGRLHDVADRGYDFRATEVSVSKTRVAAPFHTDSTSLRTYPNVVGLLCVRPALEGGESLIVSGCRAFLALADHRPEVLPALFRDHVRNPVTPGDEDVDVTTNRFPIYSYGRFWSGPTLRYMRHWIETGYQKAGVPLDEASLAAFAALDEELAREDHVLELKLEAGEVLLVNNATVAHNRRAFTDDPAPGRGRLLVRTWLSAPDPS